MFCENCGTKLNENCKYCHNCGFMVKNPNDSKKNDTFTISSFSDDNTTSTSQAFSDSNTKNKKKSHKKIGVLSASTVLLLIGCIVISFYFNRHNHLQKVESPEITQEITETTQYFQIAQNNSKHDYKDVHVGQSISTDFVKITVDKISYAKTIDSIDAEVKLSCTEGKYVYFSGYITNTSNFSYDLASFLIGGNEKLGLSMTLGNGETVSGGLVVDDGGVLGIFTEATFEPGETKKYYITFAVDEADYDLYGVKSISMAFTENFDECPSDDFSNCDYFFKIKN